MIRGKRFKQLLCMARMISILGSSVATAYADEVADGGNKAVTVETGNMAGDGGTITGGDGISFENEGQVEGNETVPEGDGSMLDEGGAIPDGTMSDGTGNMPDGNKSPSGENMALPDGMEGTQEDGENVPEQDGTFMDGERFVEQITGMDENGNVYYIDVEDGTVLQVYDGRARARTAGASLQVVNLNTKGDALTNYTEVGTNASGYTNGAYGADAAYLGTYNGKVRFMLSGVIGEVPQGEVQLVNITSAASLSHYEVAADGRLIHKITTNMSKQDYYPSRLDNGNAPSYLQSGVRYYSYDGHYFYTYENFGLMMEDYQNGNRNHSVNPNSPYYNYFQFLPLRSQTNYTAEELNAMINNKVLANSKMRDIGPTLIEMQNKYGVLSLIHI